MCPSQEYDPFDDHHNARDPTMNRNIPDEIIPDEIGYLGTDPWEGKPEEWPCEHLIHVCHHCGMAVQGDVYEFFDHYRAEHRPLASLKEVTGSGTPYPADEDWNLIWGTDPIKELYNRLLEYNKDYIGELRAIITLIEKREGEKIVELMEYSDNFKIHDVDINDEDIKTIIFSEQSPDKQLEEEKLLL
jgi:hypothetical protein